MFEMIGDFNNDGKSDVVFSSLTNNACYVRLVDGISPASGYGYIGGNADLLFENVGDFDGDAFIGDVELRLANRLRM